MLISEEFLLLVTTDEGKWLAGSQAVPIALAGGLLAQLAADGRAAVGPDGCLAAPQNPTPTGDPTLDRALATFQEHFGKKPKDVLGKLAKGLGDELYDRLAAAGVVECLRGRFLRPNRFPLLDPGPRKLAWSGVAAVLGEKTTPDLRTGTLLGLVHAAGAVPAVFPPGQFGMTKKDLTKHARGITEGDWASGAVGRAVHDAQAAAMAATIAAVSAATTAATVAST